MENPATWNLLISSLAVCDLQKPDKVWAFLALQGLVRDLPGDRDFFYGIIHQEKAYGEITGPSLQSRIAGRLQEFGIALALSAEPDPNAEIARKRVELLHDLMKDKEPFRAVRQSLFCTHCGFEIDRRPDICPACGQAFHDFSETCIKPCEQCRAMNPLSAAFCCSCGKSFGSVDNSINRLIFARPPSVRNYFHQPRSYCSYCGGMNNPNYKYCRICGVSGTDNHLMRAPHVTGTIDRQNGRKTSDDEEAYSYWQTRMFRLTAAAQKDKSVADLLSVTFSAIQDMVAMKELLIEKGIWDEELYKKLRIERMIDDHSGAGATPWQSYSHFPYTLDEEEFLEKVFNASKEEIEKFKERVETIEELS
jgi:hypothetical protein